MLHAVGQCVIDNSQGAARSAARSALTGAAAAPTLAALEILAERLVVERLIERALFASRWLLAPVYLGLSLTLLLLGIKFFEEVWHLAHVWQVSESDMILGVLALIDLSLVASLVVMVMFSGYENFVSRLDIGEGDDKLGWLGKLDAGTLKLKVAASIVAISSIHLLQKFVNIENTPNDKLMWYVILHLTFVVSALLMGVLDRIAFASHRDDDGTDAKH